MTFRTPKEEREKKYQEFAELMQKVQTLYTELGEKIQEKMKEVSAEATTTIFVTMETSNAMRIVAMLNDTSLMAKCRYYLTCCQAGNRFTFERNGVEYETVVERAPEPEDIIWTNLGVSSG